MFTFDGDEGDDLPIDESPRLPPISKERKEDEESDEDEFDPYHSLPSSRLTMSSQYTFQTSDEFEDDEERKSNMTETTTSSSSNIGNPSSKKQKRTSAYKSKFKHFPKAPLTIPSSYKTISSHFLPNIDVINFVAPILSITF